MVQVVNLSSDPWTLGRFADAAALERFYRGAGCDGVELILCGEDFAGKLQPGMVKGLHLVFYPEWIALWREDYRYLDREFGSREAWQTFYHCKSGGDLLELYRHELAVARSLGVSYVVFHMGDNPLDEYFTLRFRRSPREQLDASCSFLNELMGPEEQELDLLLENMWLGCMNLTDSELTGRALEQIRYPRTGLMLDTGHLLCTNPSLKSPEEGCAYIHQVLDRHGELADRVWGMHLHGGFSGAYLSTLPLEPPSRTLPYLERFSIANQHLRQIDRHEPLLCGAVKELVGRIAPRYLCHELSRERSLEEWGDRVRGQVSVLD